MNIWVCRTGKNGEYENQFLQNNCICLTRSNLDIDLMAASKEEVVAKIYEQNPDAKRQTVSNTWSQIDIFANRMAIGDLVLIPRKKSSLIHIAKVTGEYEYRKSTASENCHFRSVRIIEKDIDTRDFPQNLIYSLGAFRTIFSIHQKDELLSELKKKGVTIDEI